MLGGLGDDTYIVDSSGDRVIEVAPTARLLFLQVAFEETKGLFPIVNGSLRPIDLSDIDVKAMLATELGLVDDPDPQGRQDAPESILDAIKKGSPSILERVDVFNAVLEEDIGSPRWRRPHAESAASPGRLRHRDLLRLLHSAGHEPG